MHDYNASSGHKYSKLGIKDTSYELGYEIASNLLGSVENLEILDFGCGTGRSTNFLASLKAKLVVGMDINTHMIKKALDTKISNATFQHVNGTIPLSNNSIDKALSLYCFLEMKTIDEMKGSLSEIYRILKKGGIFVFNINNPKSIRLEYKNFRYILDTTRKFKDGDTIMCEIQENGNIIKTQDTYWEEGTVRDILKSSGFKILEICKPLCTNRTEFSQQSLELFFKTIKP